MFLQSESNPLNQALYFSSGFPLVRSRVQKNLGQANRLLVPTPHVDCFAFSGGREPNRATMEGVNEFQVLLPGQ
jgi:hypothetical protein